MKCFCIISGERLKDELKMAVKNNICENNISRGFDENTNF